MKNIVVCCDGTQNQLNGDWTNVVRLYQVLVKTPGQVSAYDPGVGTMPDPLERTRWGRKLSLLSGLAFGTGFKENVFDAYRYLMQVYEPGDRVYLFGFSRGAFTARALAGLIHAVGLLRPGTDNLLPYAWSYYRVAIQPDGARACGEVRRELSRPCQVAFLGLWDTVSSVGMYNWNQTFPWTYENPGVDQVRHAVSLDERRAGFRSNVFKADPTPLANGRPRVMNVWFPGVHSDIGGGYPWTESGLAMIAFQWLVREAESAGLAVDEARLAALLAECPPDPTGPIHQSLIGGWWLLEYVPARRFNWTTKKSEWRWQPAKPRTMLPGAVLHRSVLERIERRADYRPANLPTHSTTELRKLFPIES